MPPDPSPTIAAIERDPRLRCTIGMRFYFDARIDARASIAAVWAHLDAIRSSSWTTLVLSHKDHPKPEVFTAAKAAQLERWLLGPSRHERLIVQLATARGVCDDVFGFDVAKPGSTTRAHVVYRAWPIAWAGKHLEQLEGEFRAIVECHEVFAGHLGAMLVESHAWPPGVALGEVLQSATATCVAHPEWDRLELAVNGIELAGVNWWTYLGAELMARCPGARASTAVDLRGGRALRASPSPFGAEALAGQAALHAELAALIVPNALSLMVPYLEGIMRHEPEDGLLHTALALHRANHETGMGACGAHTHEAWAKLLDEYLDTAHRLRALGLPEHDATGWPSWAHANVCVGLLPTILQRAPRDISPTRLAEHYAAAWTELAGGRRDHHGVELRAKLLAHVAGLGPVARKIGWRDPDVHRRIELVGALPALYAAGGHALVQPYFDEAVRMADAHPVIHHALARIYAAEEPSDLVQFHVEAARRSGYAHAAHLATDDFLGTEPVAEPEPRAAFEPAQVVFASDNLVLVHHESRGRFTFHCAQSGTAKGDVVEIGGFDGVKARYLRVSARVHEEW